MQEFVQIVAKSEIECGRGQNGDWERQYVIAKRLTDEGELYALECFGKRRVGRLEELQVGEVVRITFKASSHEYSGKWFTKLELLAWSRSVPVKQESTTQFD